jgi:hypothetical protein
MQTAHVVRVLRVAPLVAGVYADETFGKVIFEAGADISDLAKLACIAFPHWHADAGQVALFLVPEGRERAVAIQLDPLSAADILNSVPLFADEAVIAGSWLLARVPRPFSPSPLAITTTPVQDIASSLVTVVLRALRLEAARPSVDVRLWSRPGVLSAKLDEDFEIFKSGVAAAARVSAASARLYFFRGAVVLDKRIPLDDSAALRDFAASGVAVWVFEGTASPGVPPTQDTLDEVAPPPTHSSRRSSVQQRSFRDAVLRRDGGSCVVCGLTDVAGTKSLLEAAHVIAARAPKSVIDSALLLNVYDTNNGITLCGDCHHWYDRYLWCVQADGTVAVADALCARTDCERWLGLRGRVLLVPTEPMLRAAWPPPHHWVVQERLFEAATAARREVIEGYPFSCEKCDARFETLRGLLQHFKCVMGRYVFTPIFRRAYPAAAASAAAASAGGGYKLDFTDQGEGGGVDSDASELG